MASLNQADAAPTAGNDSSARELPPVSVLVRSYHRREHMLKLVAAVLDQDHPCFEIIVVEQSEWSAEERAPLDALAEKDSRLRVIYSKPLGLGGCRDEFLSQAQHAILLSFDDDDLPLGSSIVSGHARNYLDPTIVAVTGRHVYDPDEQCGYNRFRARRSCLRYNFFGYPHAFCRLDERIESVHWVHGTNGSIRAEVVHRVGGWGESTEHDEHPLCLQLQNQLLPGERLVFDPSIKLLRNKDIPGGAAVRWAGPRRIFANWLRYYHRLVIPNRRVRSIPIYPLFPLASAFSAARWVWKEAKSYESYRQRLFAIAMTIAAWPLWYLAEVFGRSVHPLERR
ncbi:MAG: glycosyltransferase family 2 protein [Deltaproteobacteria bacterium]|nr:glycosyltransferase family 2 protein [Deltaproteobacteria bacterium]